MAGYYVCMYNKRNFLLSVPKSKVHVDMLCWRWVPRGWNNEHF